MADWLAPGDDCANGPLLHFLCTNTTVVIKPELRKRVHWTKVLADTFVCCCSSSRTEVSVHTWVQRQGKTCLSIRPNTLGGRLARHRRRALTDPQEHVIRGYSCDFRGLKRTMHAPSHSSLFTAEGGTPRSGTAPIVCRSISKRVCR